MSCGFRGRSSMRLHWRSELLLPALVLASSPLVAQQRSQRSSAALRDTLVGIVLDQYAGWEPQSGTEVDAIARARKYFVTDSTFAMIIDATYRGTYDQWAERTQISIPETYREYREQHHHITNARLLPLGDDAASL